jgi:hypothetical protein
MGVYSPPPESTYAFRKCCEAIRAAVPIEVIARRYTELNPLGGRAWFDGRCQITTTTIRPSTSTCRGGGTATAAVAAAT